MKYLISIINCEWTKSRSGRQQAVRSSSSKSQSDSFHHTSRDKKSQEKASHRNSPSWLSSRKSEACARRSSTWQRLRSRRTSRWGIKNTAVLLIRRRRRRISCWREGRLFRTTRIRCLGNCWKWSRKITRTREMRWMKTSNTKLDKVFITAEILAKAPQRGTFSRRRGMTRMSWRKTIRETINAFKRI